MQAFEGSRIKGGVGENIFEEVLIYIEIAKIFIAVVFIHSFSLRAIVKDIVQDACRNICKIFLPPFRAAESA